MGVSLSGWASGVGEDFVAFPSGVFVRFVVLISEGRQGRAQVELEWSGAWVGEDFFSITPGFDVLIPERGGRERDHTLI